MKEENESPNANTRQKADERRKNALRIQRSLKFLMSALDDCVFLSFNNMQKQNESDQQNGEAEFRKFPRFIRGFAGLSFLANENGDHKDLIYDAMLTMKVVDEVHHRNFSFDERDVFAFGRAFNGHHHSIAEGLVPFEDVEKKMEIQASKHVTEVARLLSLVSGKEKERFLEELEIARMYRYDDFPDKNSMERGLMRKYLPEIDDAAVKKQLLKEFYSATVRNKHGRKDNSIVDINAVLLSLGEKFDVDAKSVVVEAIKSKPVDLYDFDMLTNYAKIYPQLEAIGATPSFLNDKDAYIHVVSTQENEFEGQPENRQAVIHFLKRQADKNDFLAKVFLDSIEGFQREAGKIEGDLLGVMEALRHPNNEVADFGSCHRYYTNYGARMNSYLIRTWFASGFLMIQNAETKEALLEMTYQTPEKKSYGSVNKFLEAIGYQARSNLDAHYPTLLKIIEDPKVLHIDKFMMVFAATGEKFTPSECVNALEDNHKLRAKGDLIIACLKKVLEDPKLSRECIYFAQELIKNDKRGGCLDGFTDKEKRHLAQHAVREFGDAMDLRHIFKKENHPLFKIIEESDVPFQIKMDFRHGDHQTVINKGLIETLKSQFPRISVTAIKKIEKREKSLAAKEQPKTTDGTGVDVKHSHSRRSHPTNKG